jgi:hypothetical protein
MRTWGSMRRAERAVLVALVLLVLAWLPGTLAGDLRGLRSNLRLSHAGRTDARGPAARAGSDLELVRLAQARIPAGASYAVVLGGRWRGPQLAAAREAGQSWTQFALAPRAQVARTRASWLLVLGSRPANAGILRARHMWRVGEDWLVELP